MFTVLYYCIMGVAGLLLMQFVGGLLGWPLTLLILAGAGWAGWKESTRRTISAD